VTILLLLLAYPPQSHSLQFVRSLLRSAEPMVGTIIER